jgi:hypothetical protein
MAITALRVVTDATEYSRYEPSHRTITVTLVPTGTPDAGEAVVVSVRHTERPGLTDEDAAVMTKTVAAAGGEARFVVPFALGADDFGPDRVHTATSGEYFVRAVAPSGTYESSHFWIVLVTAAELKATWTFGVPLTASEVVEVKQQPRQITGVTVVDVPITTETGTHTLALDHTAAPPGWTLSWDGGAPVPLDPVVTQQYLLFDADGQRYVGVRADPLALPPADITETLVVAQAQMTSEMLAHYLAEAKAFIEARLGFYIEPTLVTTDPSYAPGDGGLDDRWDQLGQALTQQKQYGVHFRGIKLPQRWLLTLKRLSAHISGTKLADVTGDWWTVARQSAMIQLVPSAHSILPWTAAGNPLMSIFYSGRDIPDFWHYYGWFGLPDLLSYRAVVKEAVARKGAALALIQAGLAYRGGLASESTSRDGLSNSTAYMVGGMYGLYSGAVTAHEQWLEENLNRMKARLGGVEMVTLQ